MGGSTFCKKGAAAPSKIYKEIYVHGKYYTFNSLIGSESYYVPSPYHVSISRMSPFTQFSIAYFLSTCIAFPYSRTFFFFITLVSGQSHSQLSSRRGSSAPTERMLNPLWPGLEVVMADTSAEVPLLTYFSLFSLFILFSIQNQFCI